MNRYKYVFFDLDGTVFDSGEGIKKSAKYALKKFDITISNDYELNRFIGPPLRNSFMEYYNLTADDAEKAIGFYREYYSEEGIFQGQIYNGITELLEYIHSKGIIAALATSKPEVYAERIIKHFGLDKYFTLISGATFDEKLVEKYDIIVNTASRLGVSAMSDVLMAGDRKYDIEGGKRAGTATVGVLYGYGSYSELYASDSDFIVSDADKIIKILT